MCLDKAALLLIEITQTCLIYLYFDSKGQVKCVNEQLISGWCNVIYSVLTFDLIQQSSTVKASLAFHRGEFTWFPPLPMSADTHCFVLWTPESGCSLLPRPFALNSSSFFQPGDATVGFIVCGFCFNKLHTNQASNRQKDKHPKCISNSVLSTVWQRKGNMVLESSVVIVC